VFGEFSVWAEGFGVGGDGMELLFWICLVDEVRGKEMYDYESAYG
jgi:hypothetical protein